MLYRAFLLSTDDHFLYSKIFCLHTQKRTGHDLHDSFFIFCEYLDFLISLCPNLGEEAKKTIGHSEKWRASSFGPISSHLLYTGRDSRRPLIDVFFLFVKILKKIPKKLIFKIISIVCVVVVVVVIVSLGSLRGQKFVLAAHPPSERKKLLVFERLGYAIIHQQVKKDSSLNTRSC